MLYVWVSALPTDIFYNWQRLVHDSVKYCGLLATVRYMTVLYSIFFFNFESTFKCIKIILASFPHSSDLSVSRWKGITECLWLGFRCVGTLMTCGPRSSSTEPPACTSGNTSAVVLTQLLVQVCSETDEQVNVGFENVYYEKPKQRKKHSPLVLWHSVKSVRYRITLA